MNSVWKRLSPWIFFFVVVGLLVSTFYLQSQRKNVGLEMTFSNFLSQLHEGRIHDVTISGQDIIGHFSDNRTFQTFSPPHTNVSDRLLSSHVEITVKPESAGARLWWTALTIGLPIILIAIWAYLWRLSQSGGLGGIRSTGLGKSKAKLLTEMSGKVTFDDVAGVDEAKEDLQEIVEFLRDPAKFQRLGGRIPRGVLLVGPPGTGKTLLARTIAGEAGVPFFLISGSDFVEMFVGIGASRVRDMFDQAKKNAPCIIFVDEIDAVGRHRGAGLGGGNDEREQTLNQLLVEMDGFEANEGIILIAATNRPDVLDPALMRPGRFDRQIQVPNPDFIGREKILKVHARKVPLAPDVDLKVVARGTPGFSGADLMNLVNEAALLAARRSKRIVTNQEFEDARDKIMMGAERRTLSMTEEEKKLTAYHEGGHALVQLTVPGAMPIHKATIIPRGRALGMVQGLPERDQVSQAFEQLTAMLAIAMGGRVAEELIFGHDKVTSGAASDIQQCTRVARAMITQLGFSDKLGTVAYAEPQQEQFLGYSLGRQQSLSEATQQTIDAEVRRLVQEAYDKARQILTEKRAQLDTIANALLEFETLSGEEMKGLLQGKRPVRESMDVAPPDNEDPNFNLPENAVSQAKPQRAMEPLAAYRVRGEANLSTDQSVGPSR
ncbi:MAG: ATP-dependent metallopeptidase FtsH/Yme1/Tma family protein [Hyphomicrobiales bacterium]|nr:MAG: ATP-dependent metallopeptidase FtsH/Yme1/Tma family protein [Hyphomicrobiales bacterium]